jgi:hypothetical protein
MKDAKGHGSNPRGAHAAGTDQVGRDGLVGYHATTAAFDKFADPNDSNQWEMIDRRLGTHFAADPEVSNSFVVKKDQGTWSTPPADFSPEGSRIMRVALPPKDQFLRVDQPQYDLAKQQGQPRTRGNIQSDQTAIENLIGKIAYTKDPELFGQMIARERNMTPEQGQTIAKALVAGKTAPMPVTGANRPYSSVDEYLKNYGVLPMDPAVQKRMVNLARQELQAQGYKGLRYRDTSPMEMEHAKDSHAYILFDGNDAKPRYGK